MEKYESLRNGKIGTVVEKTEDGVVLDFDGVQKLVRTGNLKRWYKFCGLTQEEVEEQKDERDSNAKLIAMVSKPNEPNGDYAPKQDCAKLAAKVINYIHSKGCVTKKTCSYTRVRIDSKSQNIMEVWWGKKVKNMKIVVRSEAVSDERIRNLGKLYGINNFYTLDLFFRFDNSSDITDIYKLIDMVYDYEKTHGVRERGHGKKGEGRVNGRPALKYKREFLGIPDDITRQKMQAELEKGVNELEQKIPTIITPN